MQIRDLLAEEESLIRQVAALLIDGFAQHSPEAWPTLESALAEVYASFDAEHISRVALDEAGAAVGWIGGSSQYDGHVWELHPLVVDINHQHRGIGRALVADFEACVRARGGLTVLLGTDDEAHQTTLAGIDLYPDIYAHIQRIANLQQHPYEFYQKLGYVIVGVVPDANGMGKPDILMAKSMVRQTGT